MARSVSPASSVSMGFDVAYLTNTHAADFAIPNSDRVLSSVDVTFSTIVWTQPYSTSQANSA